MNSPVYRLSIMTVRLFSARTTVSGRPARAPASDQFRVRARSTSRALRASARFFSSGIPTISISPTSGAGPQ